MQRTQSFHAPNSSAPRQTPRGEKGCQVTGCTKKACHAAFGSTKIPSRYCYKHTCPKVLPIEDGYHCPTPRATGQTYCEKHMRCAGPDCREIGEYPEEEVVWYCQRHRCTKDGCKDGAKNALTKRCDRHQECAAHGCNALPDKVHNSNFCVAHTCSFGTCSIQAVENRRCPEHTSIAQFQCAKPGCRTRKMQSHRRFCLDHGCRIEKCDGERYGNGTLCADHNCTANNCYKAVKEPENDGPLPLFCPEHACRDPDCHLYMMKRPSSFCDKHTCKHPDCIKRTTNGPDSFCDAHRFTPCKVDGCRFPAMGNDNYCKAKHGCVEAGCQKVRLSVRMGDLEQGEVDLVRCLAHDREWQARQWKEKYDRLLADYEKLKVGERKPMQATVEDDTEDETLC